MSDRFVVTPHAAATEHRKQNWIRTWRHFIDHPNSSLPHLTGSLYIQSNLNIDRLADPSSGQFFPSGCVDISA